MAVRWLVPLLDGLVYRLEGLFSLATDEGADPVLVPAAVASGSIGSAPSAGSDESGFAQDFITYRLLDEDRHRSPSARLALYRTLLESADSADLPRSGEAVMLEACDPDGTRWTVRRVLRPALGPADEPEAANRSAPANPSQRARQAMEQAIDVAGVLFEAQRALLQWLARPPGPPGQSSPTRVSSGCPACC